MNDKLKEDMSALVDGELEIESASETIDVLIESDTLKTHWSRYHLVRDVLRHKVYPDAGDALSARLQSRLADEPLHFPTRSRAAPRWRAMLKPVAGVALAASVAAVAVIAVRTSGPAPGEVESVSVTPRIASVDSLPANRLSSAALPATHPAGGESSAGGIRRLQWTTSQPDVANRLNGYLVNHSEYQSGAMKGMHPYARIVGYDSTGQR